MTRERKERKSSKFPIEKSLFCVFVISVGVYIVAQIMLSSYNLTLSKEDQSISIEINAVKAEIEELEAEVRSMQDKKRMLGLSSIDIQNNQDNIYIMGNGEEK